MAATAQPTPLQQRAALALALGITGVCVTMAAAAASDRGAGVADQALYTAVAGAFVVGSHVLPALSSRRPGMWLLSALCLVATLYHLGHYFGAAADRAGHQRATQASTGQGEQQTLIRRQIDAIKARPLADVAAEQAKATADAARATAAASRCGGRCTSQQASVTAAQARIDALAVERQQADRRAGLEARLLTLSAAADSAASARRVDPMDAQIASVTGLPVGAVGLLATLAQGLLLEVLGIVAWTVAIPSQPRAEAQSESVRDAAAELGEPVRVMPIETSRRPAAGRLTAVRPAGFPATSAMPPAAGQGVRAAPPPAAARSGWRQAGQWLAARMPRGMPSWPHAAPH
ncbi:MAG: hypothetical protein RLZZ494_161 [Pseudomonadota bacterium]|jgi:hypothetical protein|nr:hypothetical protein [Vitreoscilla filiformis]